MFQCKIKIELQRSILYVFFFLFLFNCNVIADEDLGKKLAKIPIEDREKLDILFKRLVFTNHFGYTLVGAKPVALAANFTSAYKPNALFMIRKGSPLLNLTRSGIPWDKWAIWEKWNNLFHSENFIFLREPSTLVSDTDLVFLINKEKFKESIKKHLKLFQSILHHPVDAEDFLEKLQTKQSTLQALIKNNEALLGILLGYGQKNALMYERRNLIEGNNELSRALLKNIKPNNHHRTLDDEIEFLNRVLQEVDLPDLLYINPVIFTANLEDEETKNLQMKYREANKKVSQLYMNSNVLEVTLKLLTEGVP